MILNHIDDRTIVVKALMIIFLLVAFVGPVQAQDDRRFHAFGGYSALRASGVGDTPLTVFGGGFAAQPFDTIQRGWIGSFGYKPFRHLGFVGEVSGHYGGRAADSVDLIRERINLAVDVRDRTHLFLGGPRFEATVGRFTPFGHIMVGAAQRKQDRTFKAKGFPDPDCQDTDCDLGVPLPFEHHLSETSAALVTGAGVDVRVTDSIALRLLQADYVRTRFHDEGQNNVRVSTGLVIRF